MSEEEKNNVFEIATKIGEIIGKHGTNEEIEFFELFLKDYEEKNTAYFKEKEKNKLLIAGKFKEVADKNEYIKDMYISKDKIRKKIEFYKRYGKITNSDEYVMSVEIEVLEELLEGNNEM